MGDHLGEFKGWGFKDSVNAFFFFFVSELSFCKFFILMLSLLVCFLFLKQIKSFLSISTGKNTCTRQLSGQASIYYIKLFLSVALHHIQEFSHKSYFLPLVKLVVKFWTLSAMSCRDWLPYFNNGREHGSLMTS